MAASGFPYTERIFPFLGNRANVVPYLEAARERASRAISPQATAVGSFDLAVKFIKGYQFNMFKHSISRAGRLLALLSLTLLAFLAPASFAKEGEDNPAMLFRPGPDYVYRPQSIAIIPAGTAITLSSNIPGAKIYYTINSLSPSTASQIYRRPIPITVRSIVRAMAVGPHGENSGTEAMEYFIYTSPYKVAQFLPIANLGADFPERDAALVTVPPVREWNKRAAYKDKTLAWGPRAEQYGAPALPGAEDPEWQRQRVIYVAASYIDTEYQNHHLIDWSPPQSWPMVSTEAVRLGHQSRGIDAPNFTAWVYNFGLGIRIPANIRAQAKMRTFTLPDKTSASVITVVSPLAHPNFSDLVSQFRMGDLLFFSNGKDRDNAEHVSLWIGQDNVSGDYLMIDSYEHVGVIRESAGNHIPTGVQIRPFKETSWHYRNFYSALRIIQ